MYESHLIGLPVSVPYPQETRSTPTSMLFFFCSIFVLSFLELWLSPNRAHQLRGVKAADSPGAIVPAGVAARHARPVRPVVVAARARPGPAWPPP